MQFLVRGDDAFMRILRSIEFFHPKRNGYDEIARCEAITLLGTLLPDLPFKIIQSIVDREDIVDILQSDKGVIITYGPTVTMPAGNQYKHLRVIK